MRNILNLNEGWLFAKDTADVSIQSGETVTLPHTWNAADGHDGGNDYFRGSCLYKKTLKKAELPGSSGTKIDRIDRTAIARTICSDSSETIWGKTFPVP